MNFLLPLSFSRLEGNVNNKHTPLNSHSTCQSVRKLEHIDVTFGGWDYSTSRLCHPTKRLFSYSYAFSSFRQMIFVWTILNYWYPAVWLFFLCQHKLNCISTKYLVVDPLFIPTILLLDFEGWVRSARTATVFTNHMKAKPHQPHS